MPEAPNPLTPQNQIDWHGMLHDLEKSVERMSDALVEMRTSVRRIVMAEAWLPTTAPEPVATVPPVAVQAPAVEEAVPMSEPGPKLIHIDERQVAEAMMAAQAPPPEETAVPILDV